MDPNRLELGYGWPDTRRLATLLREGIPEASSSALSEWDGSVRIDRTPGKVR